MSCGRVPRQRHAARFCRFTGLGIALLLSASAQASENLDLLRAAIDKWSDEREAWAFTQHVREFDGSDRIHTRIERYDPSRGEELRWTLVSIDGRIPTTEEISAFRKRKGAKRTRRTKPPSSYVDFDRVAVLAEHADSVQYSVPLREDISRLIPLEHLTVLIAVDRTHRMVRHLSIGLDDPMRIALGLARVTDLNFDLSFALGEGDEAGNPASVQPSGFAHAAVSKLGKRAEFAWSDFERVPPPARDSEAAAAPHGSPPARAGAADEGSD
jgi:hypothetical protein